MTGVTAAALKRLSVPKSKASVICCSAPITLVCTLTNSTKLPA